MHFIGRLSLRGFRDDVWREPPSPVTSALSDIFWPVFGRAKGGFLRPALVCVFATIPIGASEADTAGVHLESVDFYAFI